MKESLFLLIAFLIAIIANGSKLIKMLKRKDGGSIDWGEIFKPLGSDQEEDEDVYQFETGEQPAVPEPPPLNKSKDYELKSSKQEIPPENSEYIHEESDSYGDFIRNYGKDAIVLREILSKPLALRE